MGRLKAPSLRKSIREKMRRFRNKKIFKSTDHKDINIEIENVSKRTYSEAQDEHVVAPGTSSSVEGNKTSFQRYELHNINVENQNIQENTFSEAQNDEYTEVGASTNSTEENFVLTGRRIVNISTFFQDIISFKHFPFFSCSNEHLRITGEQRIGLNSKFIIKCEMCNASNAIKSVYTIFF